jgi:hypothetical protein
MIEQCQQFLVDQTALFDEMMHKGVPDFSNSEINHMGKPLFLNKIRTES